MKKLLATLTTVAMLATTTSAFAADPIANDAGFDKAAGTYSIASDLSKVKGQLTLLIIPEEAYLSTTGIADEDILYIDQGEYSSTLFKSVGILGGKELKDGNYYAKIGGTGLNNIIVEKFTVVEENQGVEVQLGDTTGEGNVDGSDIDPIVQHMLKATVLTGKTYFAADTTGEGNLDGSDIDPIVQHMLKAATLGKATYIAK